MPREFRTSNHLSALPLTPSTPHRIHSCLQRPLPGADVGDVQEPLGGRLPGERVQLLLGQRLGLTGQGLLQAVAELITVPVRRGREWEPVRGGQGEDPFRGGQGQWLNSSLSL